jgi:hypothetical protein
MRGDNHRVVSGHVFGVPMTDRIDHAAGVGVDLPTVLWKGERLAVRRGPDGWIRYGYPNPPAYVSPEPVTILLRASRLFGDDPNGGEG